MNECEFCKGDHWDTDEFDGQLRLLSYNNDGHAYQGMACRRCVDFALFHDDQITNVKVVS